MMIEAQLWHPVMASHQVRDEPVACALLGQALVLWREHAPDALRPEQSPAGRFERYEPYPT